MASSSSKVEIKKFDESNNFGLWKMMMLAQLGNLGLDLALGGDSKLLVPMDDEKKQEVFKRAYNTLILNLSDKVLREIVKMNLYLKVKLFTWKMMEGKDLQSHIDDFNKLVIDLENIGVEYEDDDKALVLIHSLPKYYEHFLDILQHGRETNSL
ncbi:hypothetical protein UlMin_045444 [Ulmus minor]